MNRLSRKTAKLASILSANNAQFFTGVVSAISSNENLDLPTKLGLLTIVNGQTRGVKDLNRQNRLSCEGLIEATVSGTFEQFDLPEQIAPEVTDSMRTEILLALKTAAISEIDTALSELILAKNTLESLNETNILAAFATPDPE